jgi:hypothetical protein
VNPVRDVRDDFDKFACAHETNVWFGNREREFRVFLVR